MNAVTDTVTVSHSPAPATQGFAHKMKWLLKREFWEHKGGFFWAPIISGGIMLLLNLLGGGTAVALFRRHGGKMIDIDGKEVPLSQVDWGQLMHKASPEDLVQLKQVINGVTLMSSFWPLVVFAFVVFFYLLGSLYDERKDRSVLFWKSLPVSDRDTVISKAVMALVVGPIIAIGISILMMIGFGLIVSVLAASAGANPFVVYWAHLDPLQLLLTMVSWLPIYIVWALPTAGWLMLCSAWAKSKPFLWAIVIPVMAGVLVTWFDGATNLLSSAGKGMTHAGWFWENVVARVLTSTLPGTHMLGMINDSQIKAINDSPGGINDLLWMSSGARTWSNPSLWIGAAAGIAMMIAAIRLRRWRDEG